ncbi:SpoU rRNA Methylase-like protein 1 [Elsinoe fawcettii]|nr:SpoU rRNA Methylase-like protein 1 [Elsinoe fawcettii]
MTERREIRTPHHLQSWGLANYGLQVSRLLEHVTLLAMAIEINFQAAAGHDSEPPHIPLATAASQFIYGRSSALACLRAARRQVHRAYINKGRLQESGYADIIMQLCKSLRIPITQMSSSSQLRSMDRVSSDRPHNGIVLDVSPLPFPPVQALGVPGSSESLGFGTSSDDTSKTVSLSFGPQSVEDKQMNASLKHLVVSSIRPPFVLLLDGIKDEGNMGNIIRTAHFYGVDALAVCSDATAPINSSIVAKAASGATEAVPLLRIDDAVQFLERSKANGWEVWASVAPDYTPEERGGKNGSRVTVEPIHGLPCPPTDKPCIILLGSEDTGLRPFVTRRADRLITIQGSSDRTNVGVDSLNVSTAAAVLIDAFTRTTSPLQALRPTSVVEGSSGPRDKGPQEFKVRKFFKDDAFESD